MFCLKIFNDMRGAVGREHENILKLTILKLLRLDRVLYLCYYLRTSFGTVYS